MKGEIDGLITTGITSIAQQLSGMGSNEFMTELSYPVSGTKTLSKEKAVISFPPRVIKSHIVLSPLHLGVQSDTYHAVCVSFSGSMSGSRNDTSFDGLGTVEKNSYRTRAMLSYFIKNNHFGYDLGFGSGSIYRYYLNDGERILDDIHLDLQMYRLGIYYFFYDNNIVSVFANINFLTNTVTKHEHEGGGSSSYDLNSAGGKDVAINYSVGIDYYDWLTIQIGYEIFDANNYSIVGHENYYTDNNPGYELLDMKGTLKIPFRFKD